MKMQFLKSKYSPFWFISLAIAIVLVLPHLVQEGMFMDGNLYLSVSKNLSMGIGTFWEPIFSDSWEVAGKETFHEQPPLFFAIEALWFKIFGYHILVERGFSLFTAIITAFVINKIWKHVNKDHPALTKVNWLPFLYWVSIPLIFWSFHNNVIENTLSIFTLISVYYIIKSKDADQKRFFYLFLAGAVVFLASLTKGVPGLFPIGTIGLFWLVYRKGSFLKAVVDTLFVAAVVIGLYTVILNSSEVAYESLSFYFEKRLVGRINNAATVNSRFWVLVRLISDVAPIIGVSLVLLLIGKWKKFNFSIQWKHVMFFLLVGISGSIPLMLTLVQKGFYFVPSLPYFAISIAFISAPVVSILIEKINTEKLGFRTFSIVSIVALIGSFSYSVAQIGKTNQDHNLLHDVKLIGAEVPHFSSVTISTGHNARWEFQTYLMRYYNICLDPNAESSCYYLRKKGNTLGSEYQKLELNTKSYDLFKKESCKINN